MVASRAGRWPKPRTGGPTIVRRTALRTFLALVLVAATLGVVPALAGTKDELDAAKAELASVQAELDGATAKLNEAESRLSTTRTEITETWMTSQYDCSAGWTGAAVV